MDKSAGFDIQIVLPAHVSKVKFFKRLKKFLPEGSAMTLVSNNLVLKDIKPAFGKTRPKQEGAISVNM